ncbi:hypothetical protein TWF718_009905 [Orbilia javanica]|uniref:Peptide-methionine (R)-S-oxide reductase n=1 Tax=Orbilia javanica TaxID=47235 RepID=A0AAN8RFD5_9PEZI
MRISNIANSHSHLGFAIRSRLSTPIVGIGNIISIGGGPKSINPLNLPVIPTRRLVLNTQVRSLSSDTLSKLKPAKLTRQHITLPRPSSSAPLFHTKPHHPAIFEFAKTRSPLNPITLASLPFLGRLFSTSAKKTGIDSRDMAEESESFAVQKSDQEWRTVLSREQFRILRQKGTEAPGSGEYDKSFDSGTYNCAACDFPLYKSTTKFKSGCGWPAFYEGIPGAIKRNEDNSFGMVRTEIVCSNCGGHLGHVFKGEGYKTPTDERHCVNSISLKLEKESTE